MELEELVGRSGGEVTITIEPARIRAYADAIGDANPAYPASDDDTDGKIAPPTFAAIYALGAGSGSLAQAGIPPFRLIHGEQEFEWSRAVRAGERLTAEGKIVDVARKRNLTFVTAETRCRDEAGAEVCVSRATIVVLPEEGK